MRMKGKNNIKKTKRKSRLKTYIVTITHHHESYGGYDHYDGSSHIKVQAINATVAEKKAKVQADKESPVGWNNVRSVSLDLAE